MTRARRKARPIKPTLQQIADMPHSQAVMAMREHYDPCWPMVTAEPSEEIDDEDFEA